MKVITDDLFVLIHSLSMTEQRYFKINVSDRLKDKSKDYVELFDAIRLQKKYDEGLIKKQFKGKKFVKQLPAIKNYLYKIILKSLRSYYSDSNVDLKLNNLLNDASVLFDKGLDERCMQHLEKAKKIAYQHEKFYQVITIIHRQLKLLHAKEKINELETLYNSLLDEQQAVYKIINNINEFDRLRNDQLVLIRKYGAARNKNEADRYKRIIKHPLIINNKAISGQAKMTRYDILSSYYFFAVRHPDKALQYLQKKIELLRTLSKDQDTISSWFSARHNMIMVYQSVDKIAEAIKQSSVMEKELLSWRVNIAERVFLKWQYLMYELKISMLLAVGNFKDALHVVNLIEKEDLFHKEVKLLSAKKRNENVFYYKKANACFGLGQYSEALKCINVILNSPDFSHQSVIFQFSGLFSLIIHFELGNMEFIANRIHAHYYFLKKKDKLFRYERMLLNLFRQLLKTGAGEEITAPFVKMKEEMKAIHNDAFENIVTNYFDINAWLDSKIGKRTFGEEVRGRALQNKASKL
jgi:hypothetical protein